MCVQSPADEEDPTCHILEVGPCTVADSTKTHISHSNILREERLIWKVFHSHFLIQNFS